MKQIPWFLFCLTLTAVSASASILTFTLDTPSQSGAPGAELFFSGELSTTQFAVNLNGICIDNDPYTGCTNTLNSHLSDDLTPFFNLNGAIGTDSGDGLNPSESGNIFGIVIDPSTPSGVYSGTVTILGVNDPNDFTAENPLASQSFQITVTPEPATFGWAMAGLGMLLWKARRRVW